MCWNHWIFKQIKQSYFSSFYPPHSQQGFREAAQWFCFILAARGLQDAEISTRQPGQHPLQLQQWDEYKPSRCSGRAGTRRELGAHWKLPQDEFFSCLRDKNAHRSTGEWQTGASEQFIPPDLFISANCRRFLNDSWQGRSYRNDCWWLMTNLDQVPKASELLTLAWLLLLYLVLCPWRKVWEQVPGERAQI